MGNIQSNDLIGQMRAKKQLGKLAQLIQKDPKFKEFFQDYKELIGVS